MSERCNDDGHAKEKRRSPVAGQTNRIVDKKEQVDAIKEQVDDRATGALCIAAAREQLTSCQVSQKDSNRRKRELICKIRHTNAGDSISFTFAASAI